MSKNDFDGTPVLNCSHPAAPPADITIRLRATEYRVPDIGNLFWADGDQSPSVCTMHRGMDLSYHSDGKRWILREATTGAASHPDRPNSDLPNRLVWFFRLDGGGNQCTEYDTSDQAEAINWLESEYGVKAIGAIRRELTFPEYAGLLRCNFEGHGEQVYQAIQDLFFRCDPRKRSSTEANCWAFRESNGDIDIDSASETPEGVRLKCLQMCMGWRFDHPDRYPHEEEWAKLLKLGSVVPLITTEINH